MLANQFRQAGVPCEAVADLHRARWEKLVWNIPFNGLCALTGKDVTTLLSHAPSAKLVENIMQEVVAAANQQLLSEPLNGADLIANLLNMTRQMDHYRPSMLLDRVEGRQLELEAIYAIPLQRARSAGVATPLIEMLYTLLELGEKLRPDS
jgi:2-dehydropantoate 2-reductase